MTEVQIIQGCIKDNRQAQQILYNQYSRQMYSICLRYCKDPHYAADALQNGFIKVYNNIAAFSQQGSLGGWIKRIIINACLDKIKLEKKHFSEDIEIDPSENGYIQNIDFDTFNYDKLITLLDLLPEGYRLVFSMYVLDDMSHSEISEILGFSQSTSRTQLLKARKQMQHFIKNDAYLSLQYLKE